MKSTNDIRLQLDCHRSEKYLEGKLVREAKKLGTIPLKFSSSIETGYPDRMILLPSGNIIWAEIKSTGKHLRPVQQAAKRRLESIGHEVYVVDSEESLSTLLQIIKTRTNGTERLSEEGNEYMP